LGKLKKEISFGCNKIYLAFGETDWRPTYYSVIDRMVAENNKNEITNLELTKIFSSVTKPFFRDCKDIIWLNDLLSPTVNGERIFQFSTDVVRGIHGGFTVIYTQLQLAYYMGITEVYLLGIDFDFTESKPTGAKTSAGEEILLSNGEINHFHRDYRPKGERWTTPNMGNMYKAFQVAKEVFEKDNRRIYNASRSTKLDVYETVNFDSLL
jgi:hypothetical protein